MTQPTPRAGHAPMDDLESWFDKGVTDGLPVVPPTRERVERMLAGSTRARGELIGEVAPNYGRATAEKVAINAVMAGCRPDYLPVVLAGALRVALLGVQPVPRGDLLDGE